MRQSARAVDPERQEPRVAMLLGGFDPPSRAADVAAGHRPSNDVRVLVDRFGAEVFDFGWLERAGASRMQRAFAAVARRTGQWSAVLALATARRVRRFDAVYVSGEDVGVVACAVSRLMPGRSPSFVLRVERAVYGRTAWRRFVHRQMMRFAARRVGVAVCRTAAVADTLRRTAAIPAERIIAFGQEIDTGFFDPAIADEAPLPTDVRRPYIVSAGLERRDYTTLLSAVDGLPVTLVIGAGSPWSKDAFDTDRELPGNVVVGSFDHLEMRQLYRRAELVVVSVLPTERACGMNVIGEAWAMGKPVVATASQGLRQFIAHRDTGLLVPPGDVAALRTAIEEVLGSDGLAADLGRNGQRYVRSQLSLDQFGGTVERALAGLGLDERA